MLRNIITSEQLDTLKKWNDQHRALIDESSIPMFEEAQRSYARMLLSENKTDCFHLCLTMLLAFNHLIEIESLTKQQTATLFSAIRNQEKESLALLKRILEK